MANKNTPNSNDRFVVESPAESVSGFSEQSQQLLEQLVSFLRSQGGDQDLDMAMVLESQGS